MSLALLYKDELRGFYKSRVMIALWLGLPALTMLLHVLAPDVEEEMPLTVFASLISSSISGTLGAAMLAVAIIHEKSHHVYELFFVRPIRRRDVIIAKFLAVFTCIAIASALAVALGLLVDRATTETVPTDLVATTADSFALSLAATAIASAAGVLIGAISPSVLVGVILVIYGGNQVVGVGMLPILISPSASGLLTLLWGAAIAAVLLALAVLTFNRQQF